jgi:hypothetical protein
MLPIALTTMNYGLLILAYVVMLVIGITALRKGHWVMFIIGIFLPLFWLIGAVIPPVEKN